MWPLATIRPLWQLAISNWRHRPAQFLLAAAVVMAATALVLTVRGALDCVQVTLQRNLQAFSGQRKVKREIIARFSAARLNHRTNQMEDRTAAASPPRHFAAIRHVRVVGRPRRHSQPRPPGIQRHLFRLLALWISIPAAVGAGLLILALTALGMSPRVRFFGQLLCVGASRGQVLGVALAEVGWPGALGILAGVGAGLLATAALTWRFPQILGGYQVSARAVAAAVLTGATACLCGAMIPAVQAWRAVPMAAVTVRGRPPRRRGVWLIAGGAGAAVAAQVALWCLPDAQGAMWLYLLVGVPLLLGATAALAPAAVVVLEKPAARWLGFIWSVPREMLATAWSRAPYRAGAIATALLISVAFFVTVHNRGAELLQSWQFPARFPEAFVFDPFQPLPADRLARLRQAVPGLAESSPLTAFWVRRAKADGGKSGRMLFVVIEPLTFRQMLAVHFRGGRSAQAWASLEQNRRVLVAAAGGAAARFRRGQRLLLRTRRGTVDFTVAGTVRARAAALVARFLRVRRIYRHLAAQALIGTWAEARRYFGVTGAHLVMLNAQPGYQAEAVMKAVRTYLAAPAGQGWLGSLFNWRSFQVRGFSAHQIKVRFDALVRNVRAGLDVVAAVLLLAGALGSAALLAADLRGRRYELGVLRASGCGRGQLLRLLLAELSLLGVVAVLLGTALGVYLSFMATRLDHRLLGIDSHLIIAWPAWPVAAGAAVLAVLLAGLPAARGVARTGIASLLTRRGE